MLIRHPLCAAQVLALSLFFANFETAAQVTTPSATAAQRSTAVSDSGYSYFIGLARYELRYREYVDALPIQSNAKASNALLVAGTLFPINEDWLVSLDSASTLLPGRSSEIWTATADTLNGTRLTSRVLQTNRFSLSENSTQILGHYRVRGPIFGMGGMALRNQSFKRFSFVAGPDNLVATPSGTTVEESITEVMLMAGAALESEVVRGQPRHYSLRAMLGVPVWRRLTNTQSPELEFNRSSGFDFILEGRYSWAVSQRIHLGGWGRFLHSNRARQSIGNFEAPKSQYSGFGYGVEAIWKL